MGETATIRGVGGVRRRTLIPRCVAGRVGIALGLCRRSLLRKHSPSPELLPFLARASGSRSSRFVHLCRFLWMCGIWLSRVFEKERLRVIVVGAFACCNKRAARVG